MRSRLKTSYSRNQAGKQSPTTKMSRHIAPGPICTLLAGKFSNLNFISFTRICIISSLETFFHFNIDYLSRNSYLFLPSDILILGLNYRRLYIWPIIMIPFLRSKTPKYTAFFIQSNLSQAHNVRSYYYFLILQCERSAKHDAFTADFYYCITT